MLRKVNPAETPMCAEDTNSSMEFRSITGRTSLPSRDERRARGKEIRRVVPRSAHDAYTATDSRPNPVDILELQAIDRLPEHSAVRYGRMLESPLAYFRGSGAIMAWDLSRIPSTNLKVQMCGDAHVENFGFFGSHERTLIFDILDFDETLPGPWEWDVKRLTTSCILAAREIGMSSNACLDIARSTAARYRQKVSEYAERTTLEIWYSHFAAESFLDLVPDSPRYQPALPLTKKARKRKGRSSLSKSADSSFSGLQIRNKPPLIEPLGNDELHADVRSLFARYLQTLPDDQRWLLDQYRYADSARLVEWPGSVGLRQYIVVLAGRDPDDVFALQFKEAAASVFSSVVRLSHYRSEAKRIVQGQRLIQTYSDPFLGSLQSTGGPDYHVRQLFEMPATPDFSKGTPWYLESYAGACGEVLARGHARSGDPVQIAAYLGKDDTFDEAVARFAIKCADQAELDYLSLRAAVKSGRVPVTYLN